MPSARHWHGLRLTLVSAALLALVASARMVLVAGIYDAAILDRRVVIMSGHWPPEFARVASVVVGVGVVVTIGWLVRSWWTGRRERREIRRASRAAHGKVLI